MSQGLTSGTLPGVGGRVGKIHEFPNREARPHMTHARPQVSTPNLRCD